MSIKPDCLLYLSPLYPRLTVLNNDEVTMEVPWQTRWPTNNNSAPLVTPTWIVEGKLTFLETIVSSYKCHEAK